MLIGALVREGRWSEIPDALNHSCMRDLLYEQLGIWSQKGCEKYAAPLDPDTIGELRSSGIDPAETEALRDEGYREGWITGETRMRILTAKLISSCQTEVMDMVTKDNEVREYFFAKYEIGTYSHTADHPGGALVTSEEIARAEGYYKGWNAAIDFLGLPETIGDEKGVE